jgi:ribulose 1,5-bisphosphate synthetase/thiazole synthase
LPEVPLPEWPFSRYVDGAEEDAAMSHLIERDMIVRANDRLAPGLVITGMTGCAVLALIRDVGGWFGAW